MTYAIVYGSDEFDGFATFKDAADFAKLGDADAVIAEDGKALARFDHASGQTILDTGFEGDARQLTANTARRIVRMLELAAPQEVLLSELNTLIAQCGQLGRIKS